MKKIPAAALAIAASLSPLFADMALAQNQGGNHNKNRPRQHGQQTHQTQRPTSPRVDRDANRTPDFQQQQRRGDRTTDRYDHTSNSSNVAAAPQRAVPTQQNHDQSGRRDNDRNRDRVPDHRQRNNGSWGDHDSDHDGTPNRYDRTPYGSPVVVARSVPAPIINNNNYYYNNSDYYPDRVHVSYYRPNYSWGSGFIVGAAVGTVVGLTAAAIFTAQSPSYYSNRYVPPRLPSGQPAVSYNAAPGDFNCTEGRGSTIRATTFINPDGTQSGRVTRANPYHDFLVSDFSAAVDTAARICAETHGYKLQNSNVQFHRQFYPALGV